MANTPLNASMITNEALIVLVNNLVAAKKINRQYDDRFAVEGAKIGDTLSIRKPARYLGGEGPALVIEDFTESSVPLVLNRQPHVGLQFTSKELLLNIDMFSDRVIKPAVANLANKIDAAVLGLFNQVNTFVGTPGVTPADINIYLNAKAQLANNAAPVDDSLYVCITPTMEATIVFALRTLFHKGDQIERQYEKGVMGLAAGFQWNMDQNVGSQTIGALGGTPAIVGGGQTGTAILTNGWTALVNNVLNVGDIITFAGCNQVNPQSRVSIGQLQQFVVTAPVNSDGAGAATVNVYPAITPAGAYQTVDASPLAGALISVWGAAAAGQAALAGKVTPQALAFHRDFATLACADLPLPNNMEMTARATDPQLGLSLRFIRGYDIRTDQFISRLDILFGVACMRPELAVRIAG